MEGKKDHDSGASNYLENLRQSLVVIKTQDIKEFTYKDFNDTDRSEMMSGIKNLLLEEA